MEFDRLLEAFRGYTHFDLQSVALLFPGESPASLRSSLYRYAREGKLVSLRRSLYCFGPLYRSSPLHAPSAANLLYTPSYLSERWALAYYGVIPERVVTLTSVSTRVTRRFVNDLGEFAYRTLSAKLFFGFAAVQLSGAPVLIAECEKALLDLWYLESGEWTEARMEAYRFDVAGIRREHLAALAARFHSPRIDRAVRAWSAYCADSVAGERSL